MNHFDARYRAFVAHFSRICRAYLFCPFRATDVGGGPPTQGGARRLRRLALPWANLFCPFGARAVSWRMAGFFGARPTQCDRPNARQERTGEMRRFSIVPSVEYDRTP
jgi:hypothetical protein